MTDHPHLGNRINTATRSVHTRLNKTLLLRLPLALPPHAQNASIYVSGLLHIAPIYLVFESLWQNIVLPDSADNKSPPFIGPQSLSIFPHDLANDNNHNGLIPDPPTSTSTSTSPCPPHIRSVLAHLLLPTLLRSPSLHRDISTITGWSPDLVSSQLRAASQTGRLAAFLAHTKRSVAKKPHVLLAYAWVLYMALFSGGRIIRASLEAAGPDFWGGEVDPVAPTGERGARPRSSPPTPSPTTSGDNDDSSSSSSTPLSFFRFDTPLDGEDLKAEFKKRLAEAEARLSSDEVDDIAQEAICVFDNMILLVAQLDGVCATADRSNSNNRSGSSVSEGWGLATLVPRFLGGRVRDSLAVARERGLKMPKGSAASRAARAGGGGIELATPGGKSYGGVEGTTATSGVHALGAVITTAELVEKRTLVTVGGDAEQEQEQEQEPQSKAVRFGEEADVVVASRLSGGDGPADDGKPGRLLVASIWNTALVLAVVCAVWGMGYVTK